MNLWPWCAKPLKWNGTANMAWWTVATTEKKSCEEREIWTKGDQEIVIVNGFRWGRFSVETSDHNPPQDLDPENPEGVDMYSFSSDNVDNVELYEMSDGWYGDVEYSDNITEEEREAIQEGIDENSSYDYLESQGWSNDENEAWLYGPLEITLETEH